MTDPVLTALNGEWKLTIEHGMTGPSGSSGIDPPPAWTPTIIVVVAATAVGSFRWWLPLAGPVSLGRRIEGTQTKPKVFGLRWFLVPRPFSR